MKQVEKNKISLQKFIVFEALIPSFDPG